MAPYCRETALIMFTQHQTPERLNRRSVLFILKSILPHICANCARVCAGFYGDDQGNALCVNCMERLSDSWSFESHVSAEFTARMQMIDIDRNPERTYARNV